MDYIAAIHKDPDSGYGVSFPDFQDGVAFLVHFTPPDKTVRVNITLHESDLALIDAAAKASGLSRSAYLVEKETAR